MVPFLVVPLARSVEFWMVVAAVIVASVGTGEELLGADVSFVNGVEVTKTSPSEIFGIQDDLLCTGRLSVVKAELGKGDELVSFE
jgi:hypothetical protein